MEAPGFASRSDVDRAMINEVVPHSCDVTEVDIGALRFRSALKRSILLHNQHLATTYTNVAAQFSDAAREKVPFEVMQSTLYKIRKALPKEQHCCPICLLKMEALVSSRCGYVFCWPCVQKLEPGAHCPSFIVKSLCRYGTILDSPESSIVP